MERLEGPLIDIGDVAVDDLQPIDFEVQCQCLQRGLPPALLERQVAGGFGSNLTEIEKCRGAIKSQICHDASVEQSPPIDGRHETLHMDHRRSGIGVLHQARIADLNGGVPQMDP